MAVIGIVAKHKDENKVRTDSLIRDEVKQAIFDNGSIAIGILSPDFDIDYCSDNYNDFLEKIDTENIIKQIKLCDGIILQGGLESEAFEVFIAKYCYENNIPCLGICAGQNNIVRGIGGITCKISNPEKHNKSFENYVHSITIDKKSKFYKMINVKEMQVNSRHKRTVDTCPGLDKVAFCEDGYPDVVESKDKDFYIGVRFHPESLYKIDENMNKIFTEFLNICDRK